MRHVPPPLGVAPDQVPADCIDKLHKPFIMNGLRNYTTVFSPPLFFTGTKRIPMVSCGRDRTVGRALPRPDGAIGGAFLLVPTKARSSAS